MSCDLHHLEFQEIGGVLRRTAGHTVLQVTAFLNANANAAACGRVRQTAVGKVHPKHTAHVVGDVGNPADLWAI